MKMARLTMLSDRLIISASTTHLSVRVGARGERMRVAIPPSIDPARLDDYTAQSLGVLAAVPFAAKVVGHALPPDVRDALLVVTRYVQGDETH